jgi:eukaryotic-like serine/threonine-protein kinase
MVDESGPSGPEHFGRYRLIERIGRGGMAEVFKAYVEGREGFGETFVIKRIRPERTDRPDVVEMFIDEARISGLLSHPNIVEVYDFGQIGASYFLAMEYLRGRDLSAVMRALRLAHGAVPPLVAAHVARQAALGLDHAHRAQLPDGRPAEIVHRDVTPSNIMLLAAGGVKVLDFGIAKAAEARPLPAVPRKRRVKGKLAYLSPEQVRSGELDGRSDVFSLGVVLWEMLVGQRLFAAEGEFQTLRNVLTMPVPPPSSRRPNVPPALDAVVARALERDRDARVSSAAALVEELAAVAPEARAGDASVAALLTALFGEAAAVPRERMTASLTAVSMSSLESDLPPRTTADERAIAALIAAADVGPAPPAPARRRVAPSFAAAAALAAALALSAWRLVNRAAPDPSRPAGTASAGR